MISDKEKLLVILVILRIMAFARFGINGFVYIRFSTDSEISHFCGQRASLAWNGTPHARSHGCILDCSNPIWIPGTLISAYSVTLYSTKNQLTLFPVIPMKPFSLSSATHSAKLPVIPRIIRTGDLDTLIVARPDAAVLF